MTRGVRARVGSVPVVLALLVTAACASRGADDADRAAGTTTSTGVGTTDPSEVLPAVAAVGETVDVTIPTADGRDRAAHLYIPASLPDGAVPLLVALHGGTGSGSQFEQSSGYDGLAEANGFLVVYPDGVGTGRNEDRLRTWNGGVCCGAAAAKDVDDVAFLRRLVGQLERDHAIDPDRVYLTGHSNGMIMSYRVLCEAADVFVAAAGQAGTLGIDGCSPAEPVSLLHVHGDADASIPIDGGTGDGISGVDFPSPRAGIRTVAEGDGCAAEPEVRSTSPVTTETWIGCDGDTSIVFATVAGASHAWMGADSATRPGGPEPFVGYDTSLAAWTFLAAHPRLA